MIMGLLCLQGAFQVVKIDCFTRLTGLQICGDNEISYTVHYVGDSHS